MPEINYFWDEIEDNVVREYDENNNTVASYTTEPTLYGSVLSQDRSGEKRYFQFDGLGNRTELTNPSGAATDTRRYSAFGEPMASNGTTSTPFGFGARWGYRASGDGPVSIRRRDYKSIAARWLSPDPLGGFDISPFHYAGNSPATHVDPSGLVEFPILQELANVYCCKPCKCTSLTVNHIGWRLIGHPGGGGYNKGVALSWVWTAAAQTDGDVGCGIRSTVIGHIRYQVDSNPPNEVGQEWFGLYATLRKWVVDTRCGLPQLRGTYSNGLNCQSEWGFPPCSGSILILDAPGVFIDGSNNTPAAKTIICVSLDVTFQVYCEGSFFVWGRKSTEFTLKKKACLDVLKGTLIVPSAGGDVSPPANGAPVGNIQPALEFEPADLFGVRR